MTDNNPKAARALLDGKAPMELIPGKPLAAVARVLEGGAKKYGIRNWLRERISASTYIGAIFRHAILEWAEGTDIDKDSGEHPLAHVIACCLLVMDAEEHDMLIDDRRRSEVIGRLDLSHASDCVLTDTEQPESFEDYVATRGLE